MLIPLSWLKEYVDIKMPFPELAAKLSEVGLTIESWSAQGRSASGGKEDPSADGGDIIFDPEITPNRPDWMSVYGIAREVAAVINAKPKKESPRQGDSSSRSLLIKESPEIRIKNDFRLCPRYTAVVIKDVKVKPSPDWMQKRLKTVGLRPINNLVDITNYVMWELGNPLHVFDLDKIRGKQIIMELSKGGEEFKSLDGINYRLPEGAIIFKDLGRVIDLCGIKGGENTAVSTETGNILIHVPVYESTHIRRTSQTLNLRSDASTIFERGVDPGGTIQTLERATELALDLAGGETDGKAIDLAGQSFAPWTVALSHKKLELILGIQINPKRVCEIFKRLNLEPTTNSKQGATLYRVAIPTFRNDLHIEEDLIEEVGRIYGYNKFPKTLPASPVPTTTVAYHRDFDFEHNVKQILKGAGYSEIYTYSLISEDQLVKLAIDPTKVLRVDNPISRDFEYLRPNLLGNLLEAIKLNQPNFAQVKLYELGKIYQGSTIDSVEEKYWLSALETGDNYYQAKGVVESLLTTLGIDYQITPLTDDPTGWSHPGRTADILSNRQNLGAIGELHPSLLSRFSIKDHVTGWYLDYALLEKLADPERKYQPVPKYPAVIEDISLIIPEKVLYADIVNTIQFSSKLVSSIQLLDTHEDTKTLRIDYLDPTKNLTDRDVAEIKAKFLRKLKGLGVREK